jgi:hypothetical protein
MVDRNGFRVLGALFQNVETAKCTGSALDLNAPGPTAPASIGAELGIGRTDYAPVKVASCAELPTALTFDDQAPFFQKTLATRWEQSVKDAATGKPQACTARTMKLTETGGDGALIREENEFVIVDVVCGAQSARHEYVTAYTFGADTSEKVSNRLIETLAKGWCTPKPDTEAKLASFEL